MSRGLRIAPGLEIPVDLVGESTAILAKKGAGKSNTAKVIVEETLDHGGIQVVVLDPIGHWWSLRAGADGKQKGGYPVAVFGGMHGDLPLEETAGKLLAQTVVESGQSVVLDVSSLDSNGAMQRFVYEFFEELYRLKQASPSPMLLVLEEADEFAPQNPKAKLYADELGEDALERQLRAASPRCRLCGSPIRWTITHRGRRLPIDYDPHEAGNVVVLNDRSTVYPSTPHEVTRGATLHFSHFVTCPKVDGARVLQPGSQLAVVPQPPQQALF